jgi:hypothetical protein
MKYANLNTFIFAVAIGLCLLDGAVGQGSSVHRQIDARNEPNPGQKGSMGFPSLRNSRDFPIGLTLTNPVLTGAGEEQISVDFVLLNVSQHQVTLPISTDGTRAFSGNIA